jgi:hypothetical protein
MSSDIERWYRLPVLWLGGAILLACLAACIGMIVLAERFPDEPLSVSSDPLLKMPAAPTEPTP